jgi:hypothetical protein
MTRKLTRADVSRRPWSRLCPQWDDLRLETMAAIIAAAGLSVEEFWELL